MGNSPVEQKIESAGELYGFTMEDRVAHCLHGGYHGRSGAKGGRGTACNLATPFDRLAQSTDGVAVQRREMEKACTPNHGHMIPARAPQGDMNRVSPGKFRALSTPAGS
jgi:hypothetical protein